MKHTRIGTIAALARALGVPADSLLTTSGPLQIAPADPRATRLVLLFWQMTPEERQWAELYARFMIARRNIGGWHEGERQADLPSGKKRE